MYALNLSEDGRILSATYEAFAPAGAVLAAALPEGNIADYRCVDKAFVYDPLPAREEAPIATQEQRIADLEEALALLLSGVTE